MSVAPTAGGIAVIPKNVVLGRKLGGGAFGKVYVTGLPPHADVAVKVIDRYEAETALGITDWTDLKTHLFREAENLKRATHDYVVQVYLVAPDEAENNVYIFSELCDGSLEDAIKSGPLSLDRAHPVTRQILLGLEALHRRGMIHRDIKPANILHRNGVAKLADFGLVTDQLIAGYASSSGYAEHFAPEVHNGIGTSTKSDVWAVGVTLFRLLNGHPWYEELKTSMGIDWSNPPAARARVEDLVTSGAYRKKLKWLPHIPVAWRRFVGKALQGSTTKRYRDGGEMASAFMKAPLPDGPAWACSFGGQTISWERQRGDRADTVTWIRHSPREHEFTAESRPTSGTGKRQVLRTSGGRVSPSSAYRGLEDFFGTRSK